MKIRVWVRTDKVGSKCEDVFEIDDEGLPGDKSKRDAAIEEQALEAVWGMSEWGWQEIEEENAK